MYKFSHLPKSPALARNLMEISRFNGIRISQEVKDLAALGKLDPARLPTTLTDTQKGVVQRSLDLNGRGIILAKYAPEMRAVGLCCAALRNPKTILVVCSKNSISDWKTSIETMFPNEKVVRFTTKSSIEGVRWVLSTLTDLLTNKLLSDVSFDQCLIEDTKPMKPFGTRNEAIAGVMREIPATTVLVNLADMTPTVNKGDLDNPKSNVITEIATIAEMLWCQEHKFTEMIYNLDGSSGAYLRTRGYLSVSPIDILSMVGVISALVR